MTQSKFEIVNKHRLNVPVDLVKLTESLGIELEHSPLDDDISGMIERMKEDKYKIVVNSKHPKTRQRFTLGHELGHYMLHRPVIGDGVDDDRAYRSTNIGKYHNKRITPIEESEANSFAAYLLMPDEAIKQMVSDGLTVEQIAQDLGVSLQALKIKMGVK